MKLLLQQLQTVFEGDTAPLSRLNNMIAAIYWSDENINWSGLYWIMHDGTADLGSFQGKPACVRIAPHHGVIGHCVDTRKITVVNNVHEFPGHIACDGDTRSELVLPLFYLSITPSVPFSIWTRSTNPISPTGLWTI